MKSEPAETLTTAGLKSIHMRSDKNSVYRNQAPLQFGNSDDVAFVFDGELISQILRSKSCEVIPISEEYKKLQSHTGIDFSATIASMEAMPLFMQGDSHRKLRADMAAILGRNRKAQEITLTSCIDEIFEDCVVAGKTFDFTQDLLFPLYHDLTNTLVGVDWSDPLLSDEFPRTLDPLLSLNKRKQLTSRMAGILEKYKDDEIPPDTKIALVVLGHDTFIGATALSLWSVIERNSGKKLSEIEWPSSLPMTSASYSERIVIEDFELNGIYFPKGKTLRLVLEAATEYGPLETKDIVFGKGRHACIGRSISEKTWELLTQKLGQYDLRVSPLRIEMRDPDSCFFFPIKCEVEFYE